MLQTGQATPSSLTHVKQAGISNMPGRRQNMPGRRQSWNWLEQSDARQTGRLKATNRSAQDIQSDSRRRVKAETSATPEVARTCTREQPIEDIGSTGRVNESSRLSVAKLKLNGVRNVYQTCQADVKTCQGDGKAETEWSEPSMSIYLSLYLFIYLCNIYVTIYLSILCTSNMLQTGQATPSSLTHVKQAGISNMPGRRQNMPGRRQSWNWMEWTKYVNLSMSLSVYLSIYLSM